jgi:hypothetical protein
MHKLLLTSVMRPFGGPGEGDSVGAELFHAQVTRAQGPFSLRQVIRVWALDYLAENVLAPAVTLHYPSERELVRELKTGGYTHVGINFVVATFHKVRQMVPLIRKHAPNAKIVLGGYGTVLPDEVLSGFSDAICREEGVQFLRQLLGEPIDRPIHAPHACIPAVKTLSYQANTVVGHVTAGLGCPNGCDFCCTSHFFKRKYVRLLSSGRDIFDALMRTRARAKADGLDMSSFIIIDEDFFLHTKRARQFLEAVREAQEPLSIMGFGSVKGLSQFTAREVAEMGFDLVWNAFEGRASGYEKQKGKPLDQLYAELKGVGCAQLTSMIIGFPYQDEAIIRGELEQLLALEPGLTQCLIYFAFPGTPFHEQVVAEGRYLDEFRTAPDLRRFDGFAMHFKHPKIDSPQRLEALQHEIYRTDFERLGPSVLRLGRVWLTGAVNLRHDENPLLRKRSARQLADARRTLPALAALRRFAPSEAVRERAVALRRDIIAASGELSASERIWEELAVVAHPLTEALERAHLLQQPGLLRLEHRTRDAAPTQHTSHVVRLQGGMAARMGAALAEDVGRHAAQLWRRVRGTAAAPDAPSVDLSAVTVKSLPLQPSRT